MTRTSFVAAALLFGAPCAWAQHAPRRWIPEVRPFVAAFVPTGGLTNDLRPATTLGAQGAFETSRNLHLVATAAWSHGHHRYRAASNRVDLWQYDLGVEWNGVWLLDDGWMARPFVGAGGGGRTSDYKADGLGTTSCLAGYAALGGEMQKAGIAYRLEARDYAVCHESPITGVRKTRNEARFAFGIAFHLR
jgi:hypothetical protein